MKIFYRSSIPCLFALLMVLASCSPKYGAHFTPSQQAPNVASVEKQSEQVAPLVAENPADVAVELEKRAIETGASDVISDVAVPAEVPAVKEITPKQQRKMVRELRKELKGMTKEEKQAFQHQVIRQLKEQQLGMKMSEDLQREPGGSGINTVLLTIVTVLIPPLGVFLHQGEINSKFWISLVLTILFYVPGLIYSLLVIFNAI
ncbi:YqaE/Pmp3 family membrane protein [Cesiribacter sp. SM1]|uniref:YqaE/Pmp3 family membrane protein n=1 Tax=Cesiribacter sp. SM1 TaxID=2861196 RepID=UPI001CD7B613|nr:YqaE/Pmp3 family membrane protein [Cesiribacter sp. SM1]